MFITFPGNIILGMTYLNLGTCVSRIKHLKTCQLKAYFSIYITVSTQGFHFWLQVVDIEILCSALCCLIWPLCPLWLQMELQDDGVMLGLDSSLGKDIVGIINNVFQAPWGGSHTCQKDEKALECSLCQSSILCFQLGCELLERLTPREEIRLVVRNAGLCMLKRTGSRVPFWDLDTDRMKPRSF